MKITKSRDSYYVNFKTIISKFCLTVDISHCVFKHDEYHAEK